MVDSIKGTGPVQSVAPSNKPQAGSKKPAEQARESSAPADTVEISAEAREALSVAQAGQAAKDVRSELQRDLDAVLGIDPSFAEQL